MTPEAFRAELQASLALLNAGRAAEAKPRIEALIAARPDQPDPYTLLGLALDQLGDSLAGAQQVRRAIGINPWQPQYGLQLARMIAPSDPAGAETALRAAIEKAPGFTPGVVALCDLLIAQGRAEAALKVTAARLSSAGIPDLQAHARVLKALDRHAEAVEVNRRIVAKSGGAGGARHNLAAALSDAGEAAKAAEEARAAMKLGQDGPETWLVLGRALEGQQRYDEAQDAYREAIRRKPDFADAHADLSQLIWMRTGDAALAGQTLVEAAGPGRGLLAIQRSKILEFAGDAEGALAVLREALGKDGGDVLLLCAAAHAAGTIDPGAAMDWARAAAKAAPRDRFVLTALCEAQLANGEAGAAAETARALVAGDPRDQLALALQATAWRLAGDPRAQTLNDYSLVRTYNLEPPPSWDSLSAFLTELEYVLSPLHGLPFHPVGQSLRQGSQTTTELRRLPAPAVKAFFEAIAGPIGEHLAWLGRGDDPVRSRNTGAFRFAGTWSVRLRPAGFHADHVHPRGWLSSAFYVDVPGAVETGRQGWLKLGEPGMPTQPALGPEHFVQPQPGLLVLFPSYLWHGTVPFEGDKTRLSIAFDLVPDGGF